MSRLFQIALGLLALLLTEPALADDGYSPSEDVFDGRARVKISPNGDALLISATAIATDTVHLNREAVIYYDLKNNAVRWVKGGCSEDWEGGRFSPDENLLAATMRNVSYRSYGSITAVGRSFRLVLLDKDGHETATVDEFGGLLGRVTFVNANQIVYHKTTPEEPTVDKYYLYDISKKTIQLLAFKNPDGSVLDNKPIDDLGTMDGDKVVLSLHPDSLMVADLSDLIAKPFPASTSYQQGTLKGADAKGFGCAHEMFQTKNEFLFEGCPAKRGAYFSSWYKYSPKENTITHLFDSPGELGQLANFDIARNTGAVAYVLYVPGGGQSIFIRDGDYQTPRRVKINLGAYKSRLSCGQY